MGMINTGTIHAAARVFAQEAPSAYQRFMRDSGAERIAEIVNIHAIGAAATAFAAGYIPGAGGTAAILASAGFIWAMYYRINTAVGIKLSKNVLKSLASAVLANVVTQAAGVLAGAVTVSIISLIPGVNLLSGILMAAIVYGTAVAAGIVYLKTMTKFFKAGCDIEALTEEQLKCAAKEVADETDLSAIIEEAKTNYKDAKNSGGIPDGCSVDIEGFKDI